MKVEIYRKVLENYLGQMFSHADILSYLWKAFKNNSRFSKPILKNFL